jgi:hypothetical protein
MKNKNHPHPQNVINSVSERGLKIECTELVNTSQKKYSSSNIYCRASETYYHSGLSAGIIRLRGGPKN